MKTYRPYLIDTKSMDFQNSPFFPVFVVLMTQLVNKEFLIYRSIKSYKASNKEMFIN